MNRGDVSPDRDMGYRLMACLLVVNLLVVGLLVVGLLAVMARGEGSVCSALSIYHGKFPMY
jgi:hypothetical protein